MTPVHCVFCPHTETSDVALDAHYTDKHARQIDTIVGACVSKAGV